MVQRWPRASRVDSPPAPDTDGRWGVARLVAQREAERRAREVAAADPPRAARPASNPDGPEAVGPPAPRAPEPFEPPAPRPPVPRPPAPPRPLPAPRRPVGRIPGASDQRAPRPRIDPDPSLFGFARRTRGRLGSRLFTMFFVLVFAVITVQTIVSMV